MVGNLDRAKVLEDGRFVLQGRADRIAKIEEKRVSLVAMEDAVRASGLIGEARALLVPGEHGPRLAVVAVPNADGWAALQAHGKLAINGQFARTCCKASSGWCSAPLPLCARTAGQQPGKVTEALLSALFQAELPQAHWRERRAPQAAVSLHVVPQLRVFDGHFAGTPVLAGVVQLDWATASAARPSRCRGASCAPSS